jgi:hypothetical protein
MTLFGTNSNASTYDSFETMVVLQSVIQVKTVSLLETNSSALSETMEVQTSANSPPYDSF